MSSEQTLTNNMNGDNSQLFGVSIRAWIVVVITLTVCSCCFIRITVTEPLYSAFLISIGYYFGQKQLNGNKPVA